MTLVWAEKMRLICRLLIILFSLLIMSLIWAMMWLGKCKVVRVTLSIVLVYLSITISCLFEIGYTDIANDPYVPKSKCWTRFNMVTSYIQSKLTQIGHIIEDKFSKWKTK